MAVDATRGKTGLIRSVQGKEDGQGWQASEQCLPISQPPARVPGIVLGTHHVWL